jgi:hypothetical protein
MCCLEDRDLVKVLAPSPLLISHRCKGWPWSIPRAKANVSLLAATMSIEQLQILENHKKDNSATLPFFPKLLNAICAIGCPNGVVTMPITSVPMQNATVIMTAQPVIVAVTREETIAKGTAFAALEASSAIVAEDSKPETTQTGVRKESMNAHPLSSYQKSA